MLVCEMDNVRNYPGKLSFKTEKYVKLLGVMILNSWAHDTKVFIFNFPVDTLAYVMDGSYVFAHVNFYTLGLFTSEERIRSLIYESAHVICSITSHSQTIFSSLQLPETR